MTNLLHSAHDRPGFPLRESAGPEVEEVEDGKGGVLMGRLIISGMSQMGKAVDPPAVEPRMK
jgi:hypothetical protein